MANAQQALAPARTGLTVSDRGIAKPLRSVRDGERTQVMELPPEGCLDPLVQEALDRDRVERARLRQELRVANDRIAGAHSRLDKHRGDLNRHGGEIAAHRAKLGELETSRQQHEAVFDLVLRGRVVPQLRDLRQGHAAMEQRLEILETRQAGQESLISLLSLALPQPTPSAPKKRWPDWVIPATGIISAALFIGLVISQLL